jgi:hypothetical protein
MLGVAGAWVFNNASKIHAFYLLLAALVTTLGVVAIRQKKPEPPAVIGPFDTITTPEAEPGRGIRSNVN